VNLCSCVCAAVVLFMMRPVARLAPRRYMKDVAEINGRFDLLHQVLPVRVCNFTFRGVGGFMCPKDVEYVLRQEYGRNWRTPIHGFKTQDTKASDREP